MTDDYEDIENIPVGVPVPAVPVPVSNPVYYNPNDPGGPTLLCTLHWPLQYVKNQDLVRARFKKKRLPKAQANKLRACRVRSCSLEQNVSPVLRRGTRISPENAGTRFLRTQFQTDAFYKKWARAGKTRASTVHGRVALACSQPYRLFHDSKRGSCQKWSTNSGQSSFWSEFDWKFLWWPLFGLKVIRLSLFWSVFICLLLSLCDSTIRDIVNEVCLENGFI
jgi:hypothetical protein